MVLLLEVEMAVIDQQEMETVVSFGHLGRLLTFREHADKVDKKPQQSVFT